MLLKERRTFQVVNDIREAILSSTLDIGVRVNHDNQIFLNIKNKYSEEEVNYAFRWLEGVGYFGYFNGQNTFEGYTLTTKGFNEWLFPYGKVKQKNIFISYSTKNDILAGKVQKKLEEFGFTVFLAHNDIEIGNKWLDKIISELSSSNIFIGLVTKDFINSYYCQQELGFALASNKKIFNFYINLSKKINKELGFCSIYQIEKITCDTEDKIVEEILKYCQKQLII